MTPNADQGWHLDKKVPITLIVMLAAQGLAGLWAVADIKKDVEILKTQILVQRERDDRQDKLASETYSHVRQQLEKMDSKLDRLIEKGQQR